MKRDTDLVRAILLEVESATGGVDVGELCSGERTVEKVCYHVELMQQRGLIDANLWKDANGDVVSATVLGLTWDGQDFLDAMRDMRVWAKAKKAIRSSVGSTTFEVVKRVCTEVAVKLALEAVTS